VKILECLVPYLRHSSIYDVQRIAPDTWDNSARTEAKNILVFSPPALIDQA